MSDVDPTTSHHPPRGGLDYELADEVHADTPERLKALGDPLRLTIVDLVLERAMTVTELAERVGRPKGSVAHHVNVLVDAGILQVVRTRKIRATEERFYGRVGRTIVFHEHEGPVPFLDDVVRDIDLSRPDSDVTSGFSFRHARVSRERAAEYVARLHALELEFIAEPAEGDVHYGLYVALFPTNRVVAANAAKPRRNPKPTVKPTVKPGKEGP
jgi:DNA-binding transcriptional ArsR family regulator